MKSKIDRRLPASMAWKQHESELQIKIVAATAAFASEYPEILLLHAIPNGDWRGMKIAQKLKAEGVLPGVPDLSLPVPCGGYHGMYMELKNYRGHVKPKQWEILQELHRHGYYVVIVNDYGTAMCEIKNYLSHSLQRFA